MDLGRSEKSNEPSKGGGLDLGLLEESKEPSPQPTEAVKIAYDHAYDQGKNARNRSLATLASITLDLEGWIGPWTVEKIQGTLQGGWVGPWI